MKSRKTNTTCLVDKRSQSLQTCRSDSPSETKSRRKKERSTRFSRTKVSVFVFVFLLEDSGIFRVHCPKNASELVSIHVTEF